MTTSRNASPAVPTTALVWGTAKTHQLAAGDRVLYAGKNRMTPYGEVERCLGTVHSVDRNGPVIMFDDNDQRLSAIGGVATRFWAVKLAPATPAVPAVDAEAEALGAVPIKKPAAKKPAAKKAAAEAAPAKVKITWYVYDGDKRIPRTASMMGRWSFDAVCSCGWDSQTGGGLERSVRRAVAEHKADAHS